MACGPIMSGVHILDLVRTNAPEVFVPCIRTMIDMQDKTHITTKPRPPPHPIKNRPYESDIITFTRGESE
eukprot:8929873-Ditylum_brightwellii.AAC.1